MDQAAIVNETRRWIVSFVIDLGLCPFAERFFKAETIRYAVTDAADEESLLRDLGRELRTLVAAPRTEIETTLLIHPHALTDFIDFNDFLGAADAAVEQLGLEGVLQVAAFHPQFQFAGTEADDVTNATNRSPYPTLHLIREASIDRAVQAFPEAEQIYEVNMRTLEKLGADGWAEMQAQCKRDAESS